MCIIVCQSKKMYLLSIAVVFAFVACADARHGRGRAAPYIRWGRTDCPTGSRCLYTGFAAGSWFGHRAGPANTLCLTNDPKYGRYTVGDHPGGYINGAEYETAGRIPGFKELHDHDVPCAVCIPKSNRNSVMVPGTTVCPKRWRVEYKGYLMSGRDTEGSSDYLCVDEHPQKLHGGLTNRDGHRFFLVKGACGSLKCPPYIERREITCVVCS